MRVLLAIVCATAVISSSANAQQKPDAAADQAYMNRVMKAAPPQIVNGATVVRMNGSSMQTLKKGTKRLVSSTCWKAIRVPATPTHGQRRRPPTIIGLRLVHT